MQKSPANRLLGLVSSRQCMVSIEPFREYDRFGLHPKMVETAIVQCDFMNKSPPLSSTSLPSNTANGSVSSDEEYSFHLYVFCGDVVGEKY